jgi:predicted TIM-barrel fold metal-dependent hydrolase
LKGEILLIIDVNTLFGFNSKESIDMSVDKLKEFAESRDLRVCTLSNRGIAYDDRAGNDETFTVCSEQSHFIPVGTVDLRRYLGYKDEIKRCIDRGFKLFRLFPEHQGWDVQSLLFRNVVEELALNNAILMIQAQLGPLYRAMGDVKIPTIVLDLRYYDMAETLAVFQKAPQFYAETRRMVLSPDSLKVLKDHIGTHRLVFGSLFPYDSFECPFRVIDRADIKKENKEEIYYGNMRHLIEGVK